MVIERRKFIVVITIKDIFSLRPQNCNKPWRLIYIYESRRRVYAALIMAIQIVKAE